MTPGLRLLDGWALSKNAGHSVRLAVGFVLCVDADPGTQGAVNEGPPFEYDHDNVRSCRRFAVLNALRRVIRYIDFVTSAVFPSPRRFLGPTTR